MPRNNSKTLAKSLLVGAAAVASVSASASSDLTRRQNDTIDPSLYSSSDWDPILNGDEGAECADLAVIFARGTFDWANIGPWVGAPFRDALKDRLPDNNVAFQGVSEADYAATLSGYIDEAGPQGCAEAIANTIASYGEKCPDTKIAVAGWSQGSLCARKSLSTDLIPDASASNIIALTTFGEPSGLFPDDIPSVPESVNHLTYCETTTPDPLCSDPLQELLDADSPKDFYDKLKAMWDEFDQSSLNDAQAEAIPDLISGLFDQIWDELKTLAGDMVTGDLQRWMLTPQHFYYGLVGGEEWHVTAAEDLAGAFEG